MDEKEKLNQDQVFDLITKDELSWQIIIYDLVKTEQLDPWNIDIGVLADRYLQIIQKLEEADFFISSKVLLACSLLLRIKSELLVNKHIQDLNDALYGKKPQKPYELERIEIEEDELPILVPKTPMPRYRKVTLNELMSALNKAIETENRRIKKEIKQKYAEKSALIVLPKKTIPLKIRIKDIFARIKSHIKTKQKMMYSELAPSKEEKRACFLPVLHLTNDNKLCLHQPQPFEDICLMLNADSE